jgi:hypothetical protein
MTAILTRLSRLCTTAAAVTLLAAVVLTGGRTAAAAAANCDDTCSTGKITDANPCVTSAGGACKVAAGAPNGTSCFGCQPTAEKDGTGKVVACLVQCRAVTP